MSPICVNSFPTPEPGFIAPFLTSIIPTLSFFPKLESTAITKGLSKSL